jgi:hypothetical protein
MVKMLSGWTTHYHVSDGVFASERNQRVRRVFILQDEGDPTYLLRKLQRAGDV